jgi:hypothetical protein
MMGYLRLLVAATILAGLSHARVSSGARNRDTELIYSSKSLAGTRRKRDNLGIGCIR